MAQTPCVRVQAGESIPDPSGTTRSPGDVVLLGTIPLVAAPTDPNQPGLATLACSGVFDVPKDASTFAAGDTVYWASAGNPVGGTAGSGAATSTATSNNKMGVAVAAAATGAATVRVYLNAIKSK